MLIYHFNHLKIQSPKGLSALSCTCCKTENLYTLNNSPHPLSPGNHHSTSCLYEAHSFQYLIWVEYLSFCNWMKSLEKAMAPHFSTLAWKIPWAEEPGRLQSMGSRRVGHDWAPSLSLFTFMHWRRKWQPNPVCLPGEYQGRGSLVGCRLWGCTESDPTEET